MHRFIHLLNDFSGSPRIINEKIAAYRRLGHDCAVITSGTAGFIRLTGPGDRIVPYAKHANKAVWALRLLAWHVRTFLLVLRTTRRSDVVHGSTLLTAPQLIAARLRGAKTVCHVMEVSVRPALHRRLLLACARHAAARIVYLSAFVESALRQDLGVVPHHVTYPCVDQRILDAASSRRPRPEPPATLRIGMICSLVRHKGYAEFVELARTCPELGFDLVINGRPDAFYALLPSATLPPNLSMHFNVPDVSEVLAHLDLVLSLTQRGGWIETFGLTLAEAMAFGIPVIGPSIGAPTEYVRDGVNGFLVDESDLEAIAGLLRRLSQSPADLARMSAAARETAGRFTPAAFAAAVRSEIEFIEAGAGAGGEKGPLPAASKA